jgi:hypothetical protein
MQLLLKSTAALVIFSTLLVKGDRISIIHDQEWWFAAPTKPVS